MSSYVTHKVPNWPWERIIRNTLLERHTSLQLDTFGSHATLCACDDDDGDAGGDGGGGNDDEDDDI